MTKKVSEMTEAEKALYQKQLENYAKRRRERYRDEQSYKEDKKERVRRERLKLQETDYLKFKYQNCKSKSKGRNIEFTLEFSDMPPIPELCPILLIPIIPKGPNRDNWPSLDRIDNTKGYIPGNVQIISNKANIFKGDMSKEQIERLYLYSTGSLPVQNTLVTP